MSSLESFATVDEFRRMYEASADDAKVSAVLSQASNLLRQVASNNHIDLDERIANDDTGLYGESVKAVVIDATQRLLATPSDVAPDATQWSQSASPYSESMSFSAGGAQSGIYFKNRELELLGLGSISGKSQIGILRGVR